MKVSKLNPFGVMIEAGSENQDISSVGIKTLRDYFCSEQLLTLRGFRTFQNAEDFSKYCEKWGEISIWPFGKVLELVEHNNPTDHIFDNRYVPLHWDGMYRKQVPEYQIFHCVSAPLQNQGGRTTFSNTHLVLKNTPANVQKIWSQAIVSYKRRMQFYDSTTIAPIVTKHPYFDRWVIRYNEPPRSDDKEFVNPPDITLSGLSSDVEALSVQESLKEALYSTENFYAHEWQTGDVVIADNFTLLHGREAFVSKAPRHLRRVHVLSSTPFNNPHLVSYNEE